jgi:hypothetical protein
MNKSALLPCILNQLHSLLFILKCDKCSITYVNHMLTVNGLCMPVLAAVTTVQKQITEFISNYITSYYIIFYLVTVVSSRCP